MLKYIIATLLSISLFVEVFCINGIPVLKKTFPLGNTEAVMFTLSQNISGARDFTIKLIMQVFTNSLITFIIIAVFISIILFAIKILKEKKINSFTRFFSFKNILLFTNILATIYFCLAAVTQLPIIDYYLTFKNYIEDEPAIHSKFYATEYINPDSIQIQFAEKRNLILIFLESIEYNFQDSANGGNLSENLIPEITDYIKNEQSFIPGGASAYGMGWTMGDAIAKTCGLPVTYSSTFNDPFGSLILPGATCLTDILIKEGYNFTVSKGANLKFANMDNFLTSHSSPQSFGLMEYAKDERLKKDTIAFWGVRDSLHYEFIKDHINQMASQDKPWAIWFFTVDTHTPYGYLDPQCAPKEKIAEKEQYPHVLKCASIQLHNFLNWTKKQKWHKNTTIAVMGDHASMAAPETIGFKDNNITHYWLNFFINSAISSKGRKRDFTSLDMFPTLMESIGAQIPNGELGLGRSLYSSRPTLLEKYGADSLNRALKQKSIEYNYFLYGKK